MNTQCDLRGWSQYTSDLRHRDEQDVKVPSINPIPLSDSKTSIQVLFHHFYKYYHMPLIVNNLRMKIENRRFSGSATGVPIIKTQTHHIRKLIQRMN